MIYQTVNFNSFVTAFDKAGRKDQFTLYGLKMLYDWLEELYFDSENNLELDVIALCCEFTEHDTESFLMDYDLEDFGDYDSLDDALIECAIDCVIAYDLEQDIILVNNV